MKKIVLYLEDDGNMRYHTADLLREEEYDIEDFERLDQVKEFFPKNKDDIVCVITDLNMTDEWLGDEYRKEAYGGILSGWVWLQRFVYPIKPNIPTIIYSGYIDFLKNRLREKNQTELLNQGNITIVEKGDGDDEGFEGLLKVLKEIMNKINDI